ncbi:MAG TPA: RNA 2',3'-cyclic phosphodiesterase [Ignavibacteriaceae bacterium]|nr:RNA 2',3'-cyclic phosphodiesterase [Ignavibacterium sp.]HRN27519.1 RNA 2',3'-cyclic phosphodiesterase [Ignavibacteriaceae bacterium]HRP93435.1 RNA 2',3'-cyclic phosphodiesterase [Ignavibacteriaceae bacterium]HRQ55185.1 RNA 2',3'-cyclic phosphodiesterase [Ignavibacteriaceae bacterium]
MKNRIFISLNLTDKVIEKMISLRDTVCKDEKLKWEPKERLHLTIKFIGDVSDEVIDKISNELFFITKYLQINCSINRFDFFYRDRKPSILCAGLTVDNSLNKMISEIDKSLNKFSIPIENRIFNPHITLLRIKKQLENNFVHNFKNFTFEPILFNATSVTLYKSILHQEGSEYIKIKNYKLKELEK